MGGFGSGRQGGRPTTNLSLRVDIAWMIRNRKAIPGSDVSGWLSWSYGKDDPAGSISYEANMSDRYDPKLILIYTRGTGDKKENVRQEVRLTFTEPHFGGKRWWLICPYRHIRCGKLYLPGGGDRFASRKAWRLGYNSQRLALYDRPFEKQRRLLRKLNCREGYDEWPTRPKGMWYRTFERHMHRYEELSVDCDMIWAGMMGRFMGKHRAR